MVRAVIVLVVIYFHGDGDKSCIIVTVELIPGGGSSCLCSLTIFSVGNGGKVLC